jgi:hypothetical protein
MKLWWIMALIGFTLVNASERLLGQARGSAGRSAPAGSHAQPLQPSRPLPRTTDRRFRSTMTLVPSPFAGRRGHFPVRAPWFGLIAFDRSWLWTPIAVDGIAVDEMAMAPQRRPPQEGPVGGLQLDVEPRRAVVYVDGWYAGEVDAFSGYYRHMEIGAGWHTLEIVAPDYEPLVVDVMISPNRTTTYRSSLNRAPGQQ